MVSQGAKRAVTLPGKNSIAVDFGFSRQQEKEEFFTFTDNGIFKSTNFDAE